MLVSGSVPLANTSGLCENNEGVLRGMGCNPGLLDKCSAAIDGATSAEMCPRAICGRRFWFRRHSQGGWGANDDAEGDNHAAADGDGDGDGDGKRDGEGDADVKGEGVRCPQWSTSGRWKRPPVNHSRLQPSVRRRELSGECTPTCAPRTALACSEWDVTALCRAPAYPAAWTVLGGAGGANHTSRIFPCRGKSESKLWDDKTRAISQK